jgi:putative lipoprotein
MLMKRSILILLMVAGCRPSNRIGQLVQGPKNYPVEGTVWVLRELNGQAPDSEKPPTIYFDFESRKVTGFGGCNRFTGFYVKSGSEIKCHELSMTRMACEGNREVETKFVELLNAANKYKTKGKNLTIMRNNKVVARLEVQPVSIY